MLAIVTEVGDSSSSHPTLHPPTSLEGATWGGGNCGRDETPEPREDQRRAKPLGRDDWKESRLGSPTLGGFSEDGATCKPNMPTRASSPGR